MVDPVERGGEEGVGAGVWLFEVLCCASVKMARQKAEVMPMHVLWLFVAIAVTALLTLVELAVEVVVRVTVVFVVVGVRVIVAVGVLVNSV